MADQTEKAVGQATQNPGSGKGNEVKDRVLDQVSGGLNPQPLPPGIMPPESHHQ